MPKGLLPLLKAEAGDWPVEWIWGLDMMLGGIMIGDWAVVEVTIFFDLLYIIAAGDGVMLTD